MKALTDQEELHLQGLISSKEPCPWTVYGRKLGIVCDIPCEWKCPCPLRGMVIERYLEEVANDEYDKYKEEYPDENRENIMVGRREKEVIKDVSFFMKIWLAITNLIKRKKK